MTTFNGTEDDDSLSGTSKNDSIYGLDGNDSLYGDDGADMLIGGTGNDYMEGGLGGDTYFIGSTDGEDEIYNYDTDVSLASIDVVKFDFASGNISSIFQNGNSNSLVVQYGQGNELVVDQFFQDVNYRVNKFIFTDVTWTLANIAQLHNGTSFSESLTAFDSMANSINALGGDDQLYGGSGADSLNGGDGNDTIRGGGGTDTFSWRYR